MGTEIYEVAVIDEQIAYDLAKKEVEAFSDEKQGAFFTYEDIAQAEGLTYTLHTLSEQENDNTLLITWNGTSPVFKKRKMFPR